MVSILAVHSSFIYCDKSRSLITSYDNTSPTHIQEHIIFICFTVLRCRNIADRTFSFLCYICLTSSFIIYVSENTSFLFILPYFLSNLLKIHHHSFVFQTSRSLVLHVEYGAMTNYRADARSSTALENAAATNIVSSTPAERTIARSMYWELYYYHDSSVDFISYQILSIIFQVLLILYFVIKSISLLP